MSVQGAADFLADAGASVMGRDAQAVMFGTASCDWLISVRGRLQWIEKTDEGLIDFAKKCGYEEPAFEMKCPDCRVERADYEGRPDKWLPRCPNCGSSKGPTP